MAPTNDDPPALGKLKAVREAVRVKRIADAPGPELAALLDKVRRNAYKVTDEDFGKVLRSGVSQEDTYEAVMDTALGAAISRFEIGLGALRAALHQGAKK